ncbi:hypothetical protein KGQ72_00535 [Patescibacteria group bacterium]|nr:hypothetical protein [Patescibacteria group bacterium]
MRTFLSTSGIVLALVISAMGAAPIAHAQNPPAYDYSTSELGTPAQQAQQAANELTPAQQAAQPAALTSEQSQAVADQAAAKTATELPASPEMDSALAKVMNWIMSLFAWLLGIAMITLNYSVYYFVIKMGDYVHGLAAVGVTWRILRDVANIMFIFGFLGAGIATILNVDQYGWKTKMIPMLLVGAIFLNFSLFITEAMIDGTNLFATQFYTQINGGNTPTADTLLDQGISGKLMQQLGLQTIYGNVRNDPTLVKASKSVFVAFMSIILFIVAAFVMFSLAFILVARFVALIFFIILCPVGFMGLALPTMQYRAKQWWSNFLDQIITAPVLLLLLYVALAVITDAQFLAFGGTPDWTGTVSSVSSGGGNYTGFAGILLSFLVAMGLLLTVVIKAKSMSAFGAKQASALAGKLSFGLTAAGMRTTAGWGLNSAAQRFRSSKYARVPVLGRSVAGILDRGAKASFDVRGVAMGGGLKGIGVEAGKAREGGYRKQMEEAIKGREEHAKTLTQTTEEKEMQKTEEESKKMMEQRVKDIEAQNDSEMRNLLNRHNVDQKPFNDKVDAARKALDVAKTGGNQQKIAAAQLAFNNTLLDSQKNREEQNKEREALKKVHDQLVKVQKEEVEARQREVDKLKRAPQEGYAKGLEWGPGKISYRNTKAAENIRKAAGKSKEEKDVDTLMDLLKKTAEKTATPAAGAAPAASPAGGAPKP